MDVIECAACRGRKTILGLGSLRTECLPCKGIGWVNKIADEEEDLILNLILEDEPTIVVETKVAKKPGRTKREII